MLKRDRRHIIYLYRNIYVYTGIMEVTEFIARFPTRDFAKGEVLFSEGTPLTILFVPTNGYVKVTSIDDTGVEHLLWIAAAGDLIPIEHLFTFDSEITYFYTAITGGVAHVVQKHAFLQFVETNQEAMTIIAATMSSRADDLMRRIDATSQQTVRSKLLATLHYLADRFATHSTVDLHRIGLPLTHLDFAEMIGATRETTSIELQHLKKEGYVSYSRSSFVIYKDRFDELLL